jgi:hypothetical protein
MTALAQTYIHLNPFEIDEVKINRFMSELEGFGKQAALELYSRPIDLDIRIEEGSLKAWITVMGSIGAIYHGIAVYPDFKAGMETLVEDARTYGTLLLDKFIPTSGAAPEQIYRTERRSMTPGKIHRVIVRLEDLQQHLPQLSKEEASRRLDAIKGDLLRLQYDLDNNEISAMLNALPRDGLPALPATPEQLKLMQPLLRERERQEWDQHRLVYYGDVKSLVRLEPVPTYAIVDQRENKLERHKVITIIPAPEDNPPEQRKLAPPIMRRDDS